MSEEVNDPDFDYVIPGKVYTYADYLVSAIKTRFEIIKGKVYKMSPSPSKTHQQILFEFTPIFHRHFKESYCSVFIAPFDVRFPNSEETSFPDDEITSVVQPDLCVVCDEDKLDERGCEGAPDLVIEILSPGNSQKELDKKFRLYEENKVREYWMIHPTDKMLLSYHLEKGKFQGNKPITIDEVVTSHIFPTLSFNLREVFQF